jgi:hypothetical protein
MMRIFSTLFLLLMFSLGVYAEKVTHFVDWDSYMKDHTNFQFCSAYIAHISADNKLIDPILSVTDITWEKLTDTDIVAALKVAPFCDISTSAKLYSAAGKQVIKAAINPFKKEGDSYFRIKSFCVEIVENDNPTPKSEKIYKSQSVLASGNWIKLSTASSGIQKISYSRLTEMGISNPANVAVYSNGGQILPKMNNVEYPDDLTQLPVLHSKDKSGKDCIYFYSTGTTEWKFDTQRGIFLHQINLYSDSTYFYLSSDVTKSAEPSLSEVINSTPDTILNTYTACDFYEKENINIIHSGRSWFSEILSELSRKTYPPFNFPDAVVGSDAIITISSAARDSVPSYLSVKINSSANSTIRFSALSMYEYDSWVNIQEKDIHAPAKEAMNIELYYNSDGTGGESWLDYINLNVKSKLAFSENQLLVRSAEPLNHNLVKYFVTTENKNGIIWNISNPLIPKKISSTNETSGISFIDNGHSINEYILFDPANGTYTEPTLCGKIKNQNIHGLPSYEMIIVTHPDFLTQSEELAKIHRQNDNMSVLVLTTSDIYNEFSSGLPDVSAIRNMLRFFYSQNKNSLTPLRYVLLMGDGSYDNRKFDRLKSNFIPTYQSINSISKGLSYVMDDFFGLLDENEGESEGFLDIGIGRIPCKTATEAETVINKIINYMSPQSLGEWRNAVCFIADDMDKTDGPGFMDDSEGLIKIINQNDSNFYTKKIYLDSYQQLSTSGGFKYPDVTEAINQRVNEGALILNYIGHANPQAMAHENILVVNDIKNWSNIKSLPLFITATCEFGRFDDDENSAGEEILLNPTGGGVGLFTTTRAVYSSNNFTLSRHFYSNIFKLDEHGEKLRLGDVMKNAKNLTDDTNKFNFSLLTDPALRLAFPKYNVRTKSINDVDIENGVATIGALDRVTIKGEVTDGSGSVLTSFNGEIITVIFDKIDSVETLNNDDYYTGPYKYPEQNRVIYKGVSSVTNGAFELTFIVPKDISYSMGKGRIIYYASDGQDDGNGSTTLFNIGGSSSNPVKENDSPEMDLFINNENFKSYDKVSSSSLLLVNLFDESGINTVGTGIGHDLVAVLDDDYLNQMVLNNFYSSESNSYQKGKIIYPLSDLEPGEHKIWVKVWDVQNNSSEKVIYFTVEDGFRVTDVHNIPNPVSAFTDFEITHNLPGEVFKVKIEIYNLNGQRINQINESVSSQGTTKIKVRWNIFQSDYPVINNQWLVYRITLTNKDNFNATGAGKILINMQN